MTITFVMERETKNTIRFAEVLESPADTPKVGTIYIPKNTLKELNWREGESLVLDLVTSTAD